MTYRRGLIFTCVLGTFSVNLNNTALALALPQIRIELLLGTAQLQWVAASYALVLASLTMLGGALADRYAKRRVLFVGIVLYVCGSALGAMASSSDILVLSRVLAAAGAAVFVPVGLSVLREVSDSARELARLMSVWAVAVGAGMALGPVFGGVLTSIWGWRSFFIGMTLIGMLYILLSVAFLPSLPGTATQQISLPLHLLLGTMMCAIIGFFILLTGEGVLVLLPVGLLAVAAALAWWGVNGRSTHPIVPPRVFTKRAFSVSLVIAFVNYLALGTTLFVLAFLLQDRFRFDPAIAGTITLPLALATIVGGRWSGGAVRPEQVVRAIRVAAGSVLLGLGIAVFGCVFFEHDGNPALGVVLLMLALCVMGFGFGAANTPVNFLVVSQVSAEQAGVSGAAASASRQLGQTLGIAAGGAGLALGTGQLGTESLWVYGYVGGIIFGAGVLLAVIPRLYR
ncbi:MFS family permease [Mycetocola sp. BIGb0189]|uniref:MFS transporter n=1 Tax=Mycetocola sp. BIGb0189 TaxID=2940604 RepID=UPI00216A6ACE|nr:MFS transporter [Mycetocola sp. BIGb0189]MCS4276605.1 MFS family permease [Mycetocola sp. BIGb0189]